MTRVVAENWDAQPLMAVRPNCCARHETVLESRRYLPFSSSGGTLQFRLLRKLMATLFDRLPITATFLKTSNESFGTIPACPISPVQNSRDNVSRQLRGLPGVTRSIPPVSGQ